MSREGLFTPRHRRAEAAAPREVGPDGRALLRPWRIVPPAVTRLVRQLRAARPQPWWPRVVGLACVVVAILAVLEPVVPVTRKVPAPSSARPVPSLVNLRAQSPDGPQEGVPARFHWLAGDLAPPFTLALLDADYQKLVSVDGIAGTSWDCDARVAGRLARGGTFHWFVSGKCFGVPRRSPLASFEIR